MVLMELNGKRALVVGLGKSGVASALFLKSHGARVTVSDTKSGDELRNEIPVLLDHGITVETGGHGDRTFRGQDLIVVSPGVPVDAPPVGAGARSGRNRDWRDRTRGAVPAGPDRRHHRIERQDYDHHAHRRNHDGRRISRAGRRQHRDARHFPGRARQTRYRDRARDFELSTGDHSRPSARKLPSF